MRWQIALLTLALGGCAALAPGPETPPQAVQTTASPPTIGPRYPLTVDDYRTTDPAIYIGNVDAHVLGVREALARSGNPQHASALGGALLQRYRIIGRVEDADEALRLLKDAAAARPDDVQTAVLLASAMSVFHEFDAARAQIQRVAGLGGARDDAFLVRTTREIDLATGAYANVADLIAAAATPVADFYELALRADLMAAKGDPIMASHLLQTAQGLFADVDPFQLAWLHTQQGIILLRFGDVAGARTFFAAAHARLPQYYLSTEHLAETEFLLGNLDIARTLYLQVIEQTGNPEFLAALADVEAAAGRKPAADAARLAARAGYETLLVAHRAGYLQHAAEFHLVIGEPALALQMAQENLALRRDVLSLALVIDTAIANQRTDLACAAFRDATATGLSPPEITRHATLAQACKT
jgi:hypothetical protein